jgi:phage replication initiation protein
VPGDELGLPPNSNRGVENTNQSGLRSLVDWVQVTFLHVKNLREVLEIIGMEDAEFADMENGLFGYRGQLRRGNISVLYDGQPGTGIHLLMTGSGCRQFEEESEIDWYIFFKRIIEVQGRLTRLDVAVDDFEGYFKVPYLIRISKEGRCRSKFKKARYMETIDLEDGSTGGSTIYFGSPSSDIQIRVYEKNHEREAAGKELEEGTEIWNRTEIQARDERAFMIAAYIASGEMELGQIVAGILKNYVNFCDKDKDSNKGRWAVSKFWLKFLGDVEPLKLTLVAKDKTLEDSQDWIDKQVDKTLAKLWLAYDGKIEWLMQRLERGADKLNETDILFIDQTKEHFKKRMIQRANDELMNRFGTIKKDAYKNDAQ